LTTYRSKDSNCTYSQDSVYLLMDSMGIDKSIYELILIGLCIELNWTASMGGSIYTYSPS